MPEDGIFALEASPSQVFVGTRLPNAAGAVRVLQSTSTQVLPNATLLPSDSAPDDQFGVAIDTDGLRFIAGAPGAADPVVGAGAAYVFRRENGSWIQEARLAPAIPAPGSGFGRAVALAGDLAVIGAPRDDEAGNDAGAVYVFRYQNGAWTQTEKLFATLPGVGDRFGSSLALLGTTLVVGVPRADATGNDSGAADVFESTPTGMLGQVTLTPPLGSDGAEFGTSVALGADTAFVGAPGVDSAFVFARVGATWSPEVPLLVGGGRQPFDFGSSLAATTDLVLVGAPDESTLTTSGTAFLFAREGTDWVNVYALETEPVSGGLVTTGCEVALSPALVVASGFALESSSDAWFAIANPRGPDCNGNFVADACEIKAAPEIDCDRDGAIDACGSETDCNRNEIPDRCDTRVELALVDESFEAGLPAGWSATGLWHVTMACGGGAACDGNPVAFYGVDATCTFDTGRETSGALALPPMSLPAEAQSAFLRYCSTYDGECGSIVAGFDVARVVVNGWLLDEASQTCTSQGQSRVVDLSAFAGEIVDIAFVFDSIDATANDSLGWQVDSVRLTVAWPDPTLDQNGNEIPDECEERFVRADCNVDGQINVADPIYTIMVLFQGFPASCFSACDANGDTQLDVSDVMFQMGSLFAGASQPPAPFPECGLDPLADPRLGCASFAPCP